MEAVVEHVEEVVVVVVVVVVEEVVEVVEAMVVDIVDGIVDASVESLSIKSSNIYIMSRLHPCDIFNNLKTKIST